MDPDSGRGQATEDGADRPDAADDDDIIHPDTSHGSGPSSGPGSVPGGAGAGNSSPHTDADE